MRINKLLSSAARVQAVVALLLFLVVASVLAGLGWLTRNDSFESWLCSQEETSCRQTQKSLVHQAYWQSRDEFWIYDELPHSDFSKGGVYFLGASEVQCDTLLWKLPARLQSLIHNFAVSDSNPKGELVELKYLIEQCGILAAGGSNNLVVIGADYHAARNSSQEFSFAFADNWLRHRRYICDVQNGIHPAVVNAISLWVDTETTKDGQLILRLHDLLFSRINRWRHHGMESPRILTPALYAEARRAELEPEGARKISEYVQSFNEMFDYLLAQHVQVNVVLTPNGNWFDSLPYGIEFRTQLRELCARKNIAVSDWSKLLADDEFADYAHPNIYGTEKPQHSFMEIAMPFLMSTHALPPAASAK